MPNDQIVARLRITLKIALDHIQRSFEADRNIRDEENRAWIVENHGVVRQIKACLEETGLEAARVEA